MIYNFFDWLGMEWNYNGETGRLYLQGAEEELGEEQNGYNFPALSHALQFLMENGYMTSDSLLHGDEISPKEH